MEIRTLTLDETGQIQDFIHNNRKRVIASHVPGESASIGDRHGLRYVDSHASWPGEVGATAVLFNPSTREIFQGVPFSGITWT